MDTTHQRWGDSAVFARLVHLAAALPHLVGVTDGQGGVLWLNDAGRRIIGAGPDQALRTVDIFTERTFEEYHRSIRPALARGDTWQGTLEIRRVDGGVAIVDAVVDASFDEHGQVEWLSTLAVDVTAQREREALLAHRASHDPLTGLPNRALLEDRLTVARSVASRMGSPIAVAAVDLDGFKGVNDAHGHAAGDLLLQQVTARLSTAVRPADTVARYGGDEFVVVLHPPESTAAAVHVAQRIRDHLASPGYNLGSATVQISASVGLTVARPGDEVEVADLLAAADLAMYRAKHAGGNCVRLASATGDRLFDELDDTGAGLAQALAGGRIGAAYDPIVDIETDRVVALEVRPQWDHPSLGRLQADEFLEDAEITGYADQVWWAATRTAVDAATQIGIDVPLELDLSLSQLRDPTTPDRLRGLRSGSPYLALRLSIAERDLTELGDEADHVIGALDRAGLDLVLDHHGTGGLPIARLAGLPLEAVKIDPALTCDARDRPSAVSLAAQLASARGVPAIAVGVDDDAERDVLSALGVRQVQGAVTGGPRPTSGLTDPVLAASVTRPRP